jgi:hypothetical protein
MVVSINTFFLVLQIFCIISIADFHRAGKLLAAQPPLLREKPETSG